MKKITVLRHAEAGQASGDFDRRLTEYGIGQAKSVAAQLKELINPDLLLISSASRTRETASFLIESLGVDSSQCLFTDRIYEASTEDLRSLIAEVDDEHSEIVLVGHNPAVSSLVCDWSGSYVGFSTACSVIMEIDSGSWAESVYKPAVIISKVLPKH